MLKNLSSISRYQKKFKTYTIELKREQRFSFTDRTVRDLFRKKIEEKLQSAGKHQIHLHTNNLRSTRNSILRTHRHHVEKPALTFPPSGKYFYQNLVANGRSRRRNFWRYNDVSVFLKGFLFF